MKRLHQINFAQLSQEEAQKIQGGCGSNHRHGYRRHHYCHRHRCDEDDDDDDTPPPPPPINV